MPKITMCLEELRSSYVEISKRVNTLWKLRIKNKLSLAKEKLSSCNEVGGKELLINFLLISLLEIQPLKSLSVLVKLSGCGELILPNSPMTTTVFGFWRLVKSPMTRRL
jgi:hypothetical protein